MNILFVIAMKKEANKIIEHYNLKEQTETFYQKDNISLIIEGILSIFNTIIYKPNNK